jgi:hypothetical protein
MCNIHIALTLLRAIVPSVASSLDFCIHTWHNKISVNNDKLRTEKPEQLREDTIPEYAHLN